MDKEEILKLFDFYNNGRGTYLNHSDYNSISKIVDNIIILYKLKNAELEAKVYTYERIIANSNFAPILGDKDSTILEEIIGDKE